MNPARPDAETSHYRFRQAYVTKGGDPDDLPFKAR